MDKFINLCRRSDKYLSSSVIVSIISVFVIITLFAYYYPALPSRLPLFYSLSWGESQLVAKQQFFLLPTVLVLINVVNMFIAFHLHEIQYVLKRILTLALIFIDLAIIITTIKIMTIFV